MTWHDGFKAVSVQMRVQAVVKQGGMLANRGAPSWLTRQWLARGMIAGDACSS